MTNEARQEVEEILGYEFENSDLLQQAFIRRSYSEENGGENNEVLEFIGDKVLDLVVIKVMMENFSRITNGDYSEVHLNNPNYFKTTYDEGKFTDIKKSLVEKKTLARFMDDLKLNKYLIMGKGDIESHIDEQDSVKEDLFEAILGAVAVDCDWDIETLEDVTRNMIDFENFFGVNEETGQCFVKDLADFLNEYGYDKSEKEYDKVCGSWECKLTIQCSERIFYGYGDTKELALNRAAKKALEFIDNEFESLREMNNYIGEADSEYAINQLQELYQRGYIYEPYYKYEQTYDEDGNSVWQATCYVDNYKIHWFNYGSSKKEAKKLAAYAMLTYILEDEDPNED